ncbi:MAG: P-loop NTPase [Microgenomates group bacterium]
MKISIIGKGGAGKSTLTSLISLYLSNKNFKVAVFDADINMHIKDIFGIETVDKLNLSDPKNVLKIREYLSGTNKRVSPTKFVKTTPPGNGSNFFSVDENNYLIKNYGQKIKDNLYLFCVGSYKGELAGLSCYHTNLAIFENILSHSKLSKNQVIVADMVAGIDNIANSLFLQFDIQFFAIEPTFESVSVYKKYIDEIKKTPYKIKIFPILNKVDNVDDINFTRSHIGKNLIILNKNSSINKLSKRIININEILKDKQILKFLNELTHLIKKIEIDPNIKLKELILLHKQYIKLDYVRRAYGDLSYQIDENFKF